MPVITWFMSSTIVLHCSAEIYAKWISALFIQLLEPTLKGDKNNEKSKFIGHAYFKYKIQRKKRWKMHFFMIIKLGDILINYWSNTASKTILSHLKTSVL